MTINEQEIEFIPLDAFDDYEISTTFPFIIKKTSTNRICRQTLDNNGYLQISINGRTKLLHRLIAQQFIVPNIEGFDVNHINNNRIDNRIENLELIPHFENLANRRRFNKQQSQYVNEIDNENIIPLQFYNNHRFDRYFFDRNLQILYLYQERKNRYKIVNPTSNDGY